MLRSLVGLAALAVSIGGGAGCFVGPAAASAQCVEDGGLDAGAPCPPGFFCRGGVCLEFNTSRSDVVDPDLAEASDGGDAATP